MDKEPNIIDIVPQIIWTNNSEGVAEYFNQRWYEYTGLSYAESHGPGWQAIAHEEDQDAVKEWRNAFKEKRLFEAEARLRNRDGRYEWHLLKNVPFTDTEKNLLGWFGSATNIQSIKEAEANFRRTSTYLQAILDTAVDFAIINIDNLGRIIGWNAGATIMFGYEQQEILGKPTDILFTDEDKAGGIPLQELEIARKTGRSLDERWHMRKDGSRFFMSGVLVPMKDYDAFVKITRNITDKKLGEEALLLAEHRNNVALQSARMGEWNWDVPRNLLSLDDIAQKTVGVHESTLSIEKFWSLVHADDLSKVKEELEKTMGGLNIFQCEFRIVTAGKEHYRWVNWYGRVISHEQEKAARLIGVVYDISERKALEKQKDEFISVASHELKTPVTSIKAYTELLREFFKDFKEKENAGLLEKLNTQVDRLIRLFNVLLDSTKITQGRLILQVEKFDLNELIEERMEEVRHIATTHKLIFRPSVIGHVNADRDRIGQVITNLVSNAVKYSPPGTEVIVSSHDELDGVLIKVQDFGKGISNEDQSMLFKQYFRGSDARVSGFGLGLYISAEIIRRHNGLIGVDSNLGQGSTFYFKLFYA
jgi:PAS domain S-box-containing protein